MLAFRQSKLSHCKGFADAVCRPDGGIINVGEFAGYHLQLSG